jgi:hypothetical protein
MTYDPDWMSLLIVWKDFSVWFVNKFFGKSTSTLSVVPDDFDPSDPRGVKNKNANSSSSSQSVNINDSTDNNNNKNGNDSDRVPTGSSHRDRLVRFYSQHDPAKLPQVDEELVRFAGNEKKMWDDLQKKYGESPEPQTSSKEHKSDTSAPSSSPPRNSYSNNVPRHPVDPVLDMLEKEEELSADPLTASIDRLERCVSNLVAQLPPILEEAVDERIQFTLMERSRQAAHADVAKQLAEEQTAALKRLSEMRQAEWSRQAKALDALENFEHEKNFALRIAKSTNCH